MATHKQRGKGKQEEWLTHEGLIKIEGWARDGLIDEQIAHNMGIARSTLARWKNQYSDIRDALKKGKEIVDREVENALHKNAVGYWIEEIDTDIIVGEDGQKRQHVKKKKRWVAGNTAAQIYWLNNRKPENWRNKREVVVTAEGDIDEKAVDISKYVAGILVGEEKDDDKGDDD